MNQRLGVCVAMVAALHGAVLAWASQAAADIALVQARPGPAVQVRAMAAPMSEEPSASVSPALTEAAPTVVAHGEVESQKPEGDSAIDMDGYVPRRWLTVVPRAAAPVILPFPDSFDERSRYTVVLNLYIEADGRVGRVEFEGVRLPDVLERAARVTFENARFTPGQVNGRIVKSLIKVEVDFDNLGRG